jgi:hypothetical protein
MAGQFGTWTVAEDLHLSLGNDDFDFAAGEVTPATAAEAAALAHLASVSRQAPGDETSHPMAELVAGPDPAPAAAASPPAGTEPTPPATVPAGATPSDEVSAAEAELAKAEADLKAAEGQQPPPATA